MSAPASARSADAALAALASLVASLGLSTLVQHQAWVTQAAWLVALVALVGVLLRRAHAGGLVVVLGQLTAVVLTTTWTHAGSSTWYGVPTSASVEALATVVREFGTTVYTSAAPIPTNPGVEMTFALIAAAVALAVDHVAVTRRAPAAAGIPLLAVFLATAANNGAAVSPVYFVSTAAAWLVLVARQGRWRMRRWSDRVADPATPTSDPDDARVASLGFGATARRLGVASILLAVLVPAALPHLPTRFLLDGLARSADGRGNARVGYSSTLDVGRSLGGASTARVFTYRTTAPDPPPLRVVAATDYDGTTWSRSRPILGRASRLELSDRVARVERTLTVEDFTLDPPAVATAQPVVAVDLRGTVWQVDEATSDVYVRTQPGSYSTTYLEPQLTAALLRDGVDGLPGPDPLPTSDRLVGQALAVDRRSEARVRGALSAARAAAPDPTAAADSPYDTAVAIQDWLRGTGGFTYSLTLLDPSLTGRSRDPISAFLETKTGYCVQFASAMVMMSRAAGIPARMAIGFLPGSAVDGTYTVSASDAHAWPELYFPGAGWVRFEPTPASRTGSPPPWTQPAPIPTGPDATASAAPVDGSGAATPSSDKPAVESLEDGVLTEIDQPWGDRVAGWLGEPWHVVLLAVALGGCGALVLPATAYLLRLRPAGPRRGERVEAHWARLTARMEDLGLRPPVGATLRDAELFYRSTAVLDDPGRAALAQVVSTVEQVRYARPGRAPEADLGAAVRSVAVAASRTRSRRQRVRAFLAPGQATRWWRQVSAAASARLARAGAGVSWMSRRRRRSHGQSSSRGQSR